MAMQVQDDEFLPIVGLNLSVPVAKDQGAALVLLNARPDRLQGRIRSRLGYGAPIATYADDVHTIWMYAGSNRYIGAGTVLYRDNTSMVTGLDGEPLFLASKNKFVWVMNRNTQKRISAAGVVRDWFSSKPSTPLTATDSGTAGNVDGTVEYYVSFVDADGFETGVGPVATLAVVNRIVNLTSIPIGPSGTTARRIYRGGGTLERPLLVQAIADNTTTSSSDNMPDAAAIGNNEQPILIYDPPPAASGACHYLGARLLMWSSAEFPNRIWWTRTDLFHFISRFNFVGVGDHDEIILVVSPKKQAAYIYKERSIWRLVGDPDDFGNASVERVTSNISLVSKTAIAQGAELDYILSRDGVYEFDGFNARKISGILDPLFNGEGVETGSGLVAPAINLSRIGKSVLEVAGDLLYVSYPGGTSTFNNHTLVYNRRLNVWTQDSRGFGAITLQGAAAGTLVGVGPKLFNLDNGQQDEGNPVPFVYQSSFRHQGAPDNDKQYFGIKIKHTLGLQTLAVKVFVGDTKPIAAPTTLTTSLTGNGTTEFTFNGEDGIYAKNMSVLLESLPGVTGEIEIESVLVSFLVHPRTAQQWITPVVSFDHLMECRAVRVDRDATDDFTVQVRSDNPAATDMTTTNVPVTLSVNPTRRVYPLQLPNVLKGYLWQVGVAEATGGRNYNAKLEMRRVPIYLAGARGERWQPARRGIR